MRRPTDAERQEWEDNGVLFLENAIVGEDLARLQATFDRCTAEARREWLEGIAKGTRPAAHFDIPKPLEKDGRIYRPHRLSGLVRIFDGFRR